MKIYEAYKVVVMGSNIRYLMTVQPNFSVEYVRQVLNELQEQLGEAGFEVTLSFLDFFFKKTLTKISTRKKNQAIGLDISNAFIAEGYSLEKTFLSESKKKKLYSLPQIRFNSEYLQESPGKFLRAGAYDNLTEMSQFDFNSACRCLLYGEPTASAFHILRTTEDVLKQYYFNHIKSRRLKPKDQTWGALTNQLRNKKSKKPNKAILDSLDLIRVSYRNPTQHPLIRYDMENAQDLFGLCIDLISKMTLEKLK